MIDPLEAVICYLRSNADVQAVVNDRVAAKHEYGTSWSVGDAAIIARADGGTPDLHVPIQILTVQLRCYAGSAVEAMDLWRVLVGVTRETLRESVATSHGQALLYWLHPTGGPVLSFDAEVNSDVAIVLCEANVSEGALC